MHPTLILKTGALGDVLRTTSILAGLKSRDPDAAIVWVTARAARELVERHPLVDEVHCADPDSEAELEALGNELAGTRFGRVLSFDDEEGMCALASRLDAASLSGAHLTESGARAYTEDVGPWFDMGLLSVHGKEAADRMKVENERTHPEIFADMLGIEMGRPELPISPEAEAFAERFARERELAGSEYVIGLNTGAGGRWRTKELPVDRTVELVRLIDRHLGGRATFLVLGGPPEAERGAAIIAGVRALEDAPRIVDGGTKNSIQEFAALVSLCSLLVVSDSLALHIGVARCVRLVTFFAPTSAAEIELYGLGEKIWSTAPDYCSYSRDADNSTITPERLMEAVKRVLPG